MMLCYLCFGGCVPRRRMGRLWRDFGVCSPAATPWELTELRRYLFLVRRDQHLQADVSGFSSRERKDVLSLPFLFVGFKRWENYLRVLCIRPMRGLAVVAKCLLS